MTITLNAGILKRPQLTRMETRCQLSPKTHALLDKKNTTNKLLGRVTRATERNLLCSESLLEMR